MPLRAALRKDLVTRFYKDVAPLALETGAAAHAVQNLATTPLANSAQGWLGERSGGIGEAALKLDK